MSYPDVVKSSRKQSPQRHVNVNVTQRVPVSSAALIESEAGIKKGHVTNIASLFGHKPASGDLSIVKRTLSTKRASNNETESSGNRVSVDGSVGLPETVEHPVPWPSPSKESQLKAAKSNDKATIVSGNSNAFGQPKIVFNKTKYVPKAVQSADKSQPSSSTIPSPVRVGRWTVYETLPFKDGAGLNREGGKQPELEAQRKREDEEWKKREAVEKERIAEAERRKADYDKRQREELEAQERRRRDEDRRRREEIERDNNNQRQGTLERKHREEMEAQERRRREKSSAEEDRKRRQDLEQQESRRRKEIEEQQERRRKEEAEKRQRKQERMRELERRENERQLQEERHRLEYDRKRHEGYERSLREEREKEEYRRLEEEKRMRDSNSNMYTKDEWTVYHKMPLTAAEVPTIKSTRSQTVSGSPSYYQGSSSSFGHRSLLERTDSRDPGESEYARNIREIEEMRRQREEEEKDAMHHKREKERQMMQQRENDQERKRRSNDQNSRLEDSRFRDGIYQWTALANSESEPTNSGIGYRRFLDENEGGSQVIKEEERRSNEIRRQDEEYRRIRQARDDDKRRTDANQLLKRRSEDERCLREQERQREEEKRHQQEIEERKHRDDEESRRRELEARKRLDDEKKRRQEQEDTARIDLEVDRQRELVRKERLQRSQLEEERRRRREEEEVRARIEEDRRRRETERNTFKRWGSIGKEDPDTFSRVQWTVFESIPMSGNQGASMQRSSSQDSIQGYRRLLATDSQEPDNKKYNTDGRQFERKTRMSIRSSAPEPKPNAGAEDETPRFEEWTEYHPVASKQSEMADPGFDRRASERTSWRYRPNSDASLDSPRFEEWTVIHNAPAQTNAYDVTDATNLDSASLRRQKNWDEPGNFRRTQSSDSLSLISSGDKLAVEEIMPRKRSSGRRQRDAMVSAALRHLEGDGKGSSSNPAVAAAFLDDEASSVRVSPYHSYRLTHPSRGRYQKQRGGTIASPTSEDNGNVFQDSFNVRRDNPTYHWHD